MAVENGMDGAAIANVAASATSRLDLWTRLIRLAQIKHMAEIGVWRGEFTEAMLRTCPDVECYFMIDAWRHLDQWNKPMNVADQPFEEIYNEAVSRTAFAGDRRKVMRGTSLEVVDDIADASLDFVYIDGDHTLRGVTIDLIAYFPKVRPGYYIGGDDFCPTIWQHAPKFEPTPVFPFAQHFAEAVRATLYGLPFNQFLLRKPYRGQRAFAVIDFTGAYGNTSLLAQLSLRALITKSIRGPMAGSIKNVLRSLHRGSNQKKLRARRFR